MDIKSISTPRISNPRLSAPDRVLSVRGGAHWGGHPSSPCGEVGPIVGAPGCAGQIHAPETRLEGFGQNQETIGNSRVAHVAPGKMKEPMLDQNNASESFKSSVVETAPVEGAPASEVVSGSAAPAAVRETMNRKPVLYRDAKTVLTLKNEAFHEKLLCDGLTLNLGDACAFSCRYCYVETQMRKIDQPLINSYNVANGRTKEAGNLLGFQDVVIRRRNSLSLLKDQLLKADGTSRYADRDDKRVVYSSTLVDVAANVELLRETAAGCNLILDHTNWQIRLLSKGNLIHKLVEDLLIPAEHHHRLIFGFSVGTLDDRVASAFEPGTALVSKRLKALHWLQDRGLRTFGMICPSLPQRDYDKFSREICEATRIAKCEHVWAEVINARGAAMTKTVEGLREAGLNDEAEMLATVPGETATWEAYARATFVAHAKNIPVEKYRFLQYIDNESASWWGDQRSKGAVLLGKLAKVLGVTTISEPPALTTPSPVWEVRGARSALATEDAKFREEKEEIVADSAKASIAAAKAIWEIHSYGGGRLWRGEYKSFEAYCRVKWNYGKAHAYRLVECGEFVEELTKQSPNGDGVPQNESQVRPLLKLPKVHRIECWRAIMASNPGDKLTGKLVGRAVREYAARSDIQLPAVPKPASSAFRAEAAFTRFCSIVEALPTEVQTTMRMRASEWGVVVPPAQGRAKMQ